MPVTASPLRYPGGKTKLYSFVRPIVEKNVGAESIYVEPFAGGAGLALKLLFQKDVERLVLNDIDENIFGFWQSCLYHTDELCTLIDKCLPTIDVWDEQRTIYHNPESHSMVEIAFATLFLNRCNVSGVISGGPIGGRKQSGKYLISARFNSEGLITKIRKIGANSDRISFYNMEASAFLQTIVVDLPLDTTFVNIDPPYVKKGPMLYRNSFSIGDHQALSNIIKTLKHKWMVTYDECELISSLYADYPTKLLTLKYSAGQPKSGKELAIFDSNLFLKLSENI